MNGFKCLARIGRRISTNAREALFERRVEPLLGLFLEHGLKLVDCRQIIRQYPKMIGLSPDKHITPVMKVLKEAMDTDGMRDGQGIREVIMKCPEILGSHPGRVLIPNLQFWKREMDIRPDDVRALLLRSPQLVCRSPMLLRSVMFFFHNRFARTHEIVSIFGRCPDILDIPMDDLVRFHAYWKEQGMSDRDYIEMIDKYPMLLKLSWTTILRPMMQYMIYMTRHRQGALLFVRDPTCFEMTLDELSAKVEYLLKLGLKRRDVVHVAKTRSRILKADLGDIQARVEELTTVEGISGRRLSTLLSVHPEVLTQFRVSTCRTDPNPAATVYVTSCPLI